MSDILKFFGSLTNDLKTRIILYIIIGVIVLVLLGLLLDGIRHVVKGLDTALVGALVLWLGTKAGKAPVIGELSPYLSAAGWTLIAAGIIVFICTRVHRHRRRKKAEKKAEKSAEKNAGTDPAENA